MNMRCSRRWGRRCATSCLLDAWEKEGRLVQAVLRCVQCDAILDAGDATVCVGLASAVLTVQPWSARSCAHTAWVSEGERVAGSEYVPAYCLSDLVNNGQRAQEPGTHAHAGVSVSTVYIHTLQQVSPDPVGCHTYAACIQKCWKLQ